MPDGPVQHPVEALQVVEEDIRELVRRRGLNPARAVKDVRGVVRAVSAERV